MPSPREGDRHQLARARSGPPTNCAVLVLTIYTIPTEGLPVSQALPRPQLPVQTPEEAGEPPDQQAPQPDAGRTSTLPEGGNQGAQGAGDQTAILSLSNQRPANTGEVAPCADSPNVRAGGRGGARGPRRQRLHQGIPQL